MDKNNEKTKTEGQPKISGEVELNNSQLDSVSGGAGVRINPDGGEK